MQHARGDLVQPVAATVFWFVLAAVGFGMLRFHSARKSSERAFSFPRIARITESTTFPTLLRVAAVSAIALLVATGVSTVVAIGRANVNPDITKQSLYPEIDAAEWIRTHEPSNLVIMAREPDFVYHYTHRRVVWFPPISDPKVLMEGIRRHHVELVEVAHHSQSYWLPPEDASFQALLQAYPIMFHLTHRGPDNWVYEVVFSTDGSLHEAQADERRGGTRRWLPIADAKPEALPR
jgi:hypothetical protein